MESNKDYIPRKIAEYCQFGDRFVAKLVLMAANWGIPALIITALQGGHTDYITAQNEASNPDTRTPVTVERAKRLRSADVANIRMIVNTYINPNPTGLIQPEDRIDLGLRLKDTTSSPVPTPTVQVEADLAFPGIHLIELMKIRPVTGTGTESRSDYGTRIYYGILGEAIATDKFRLAQAPQAGDDLPHSVFTRKNKYRFDFPEADRGKTVYFCIRCENSKGGMGPWGPILSAIIP
jgi:hypothetical protein